MSEFGLYVPLIWASNPTGLMNGGVEPSFLPCAGTGTIRLGLAVLEDLENRSCKTCPQTHFFLYP